MGDQRPLPTGHVSLQREYVRCGKATCKKCAPGGGGHGPYWYAYWRDGAKVKKRYLGKELPRELPAGEAAHLDMTNPSVAQFLEECGIARPYEPKPRKERAKKPAEKARSVQPLTASVVALLATIPAERTGILTWASAASKELSIPTEQIAYRLGLYRDQILAQGVRLAQSTRYRTLYVPVVGTDEGAYYSHIWIEHQ
jgi:hypothetical protein